MLVLRWETAAGEAVEAEGEPREGREEKAPPERGELSGFQHASASRVVLMEVSRH